MSKLSKTSNERTSSNMPDNVCPNCWRDQEYDALIRTKMKDAQIDVNNKKVKYAFIQNFVVTHLEGIKLKSSVRGQECPTCKLVVKE